MGETVGRVSWGSGGVHEGRVGETSEEKGISWEAGWPHSRPAPEVLSQQVLKAKAILVIWGGKSCETLMGAGFPGEESASVGRRTAQRAAGRRATREELGRSRSTFYLGFNAGVLAQRLHSHLGGAATSAKAEEGVWRWGGGEG